MEETEADRERHKFEDDYAYISCVKCGTYKCRNINSEWFDLDENDKTGYQVIDVFRGKEI